MKDRFSYISVFFHRQRLQKTFHLLTFDPGLYPKCVISLSKLVKWSVGNEIVQFISSCFWNWDLFPKHNCGMFTTDALIYYPIALRITNCTLKPRCHAFVRSYEVKLRLYHSSFWPGPWLRSSYPQGWTYFSPLFAIVSFNKPQPSYFKTVEIYKNLPTGGQHAAPSHFGKHFVWRSLSVNDPLNLSRDSSHA